jgi:2-isopropylmalate synthase
MLKNPSTKYIPFKPIELRDRTWPDQTLTKPPVWLSTDLRDGNQSLFEPMNGKTKLKLFKELVKVGFKEIEIGFTSASEIDYQFARTLIEEGHIPEDVTPMVITQAREDLIDKTVESMKGAKSAIVHLYNATAPAWREIVFGMTVPEVMALIEKHVLYLKKITDQHPQTHWTLQYSPETFSATELDVALWACNTAIKAWGVGPGRPIIINLPTTVENTTPNVFADSVEWMHRHIDQREHVVLSVHAHNDRGTGVATAELAQMAGADRIEGCLFGNGERSGNVDIVTLALNLYTQGVYPNLDFSNINAVALVVEQATQLPIHPRHPYVGDLVFTAFSGSHQDAIKKGFNYQKGKDVWSVPYLPIDPADLGRNYDSVIRVNSQSGKGGIGYLLESNYGVVLPRRMLVEFSSVVQKITDQSETEITARELYQLFQATYIDIIQSGHTFEYQSHHLTDNGLTQDITLTLMIKGQSQTFHGTGNGPIEATLDALDLPMSVLSYEERSIGSGADARAIAIIETAVEGSAGSKFGAGIDTNIVSASIKAIVSSVNRHDLPLPTETTPA